MTTKPRVCVLRAPGTNCDRETAAAFELCGATAERLHLYRLLEQPEQLLDYQILCFPGGFSYGDDLGAGVVFSASLKAHLGDVMARWLAADKLTLGICNGFQTLLKAGILPDGAGSWQHPRHEASATLTWNENGRYTARWVRLKVASDRNVFLRGLDEIELPIAHAEGRIVVKDSSLTSQWRKNGQVALTYIPANDDIDQSRQYRIPNPNGSTDGIAALGDATGRVLGLMPHPERFLFGTQHPRWTRDQTGDQEGAGLKLFHNAVAYFG